MPAGLQQPSASQTHCPGQARPQSHDCHRQGFPGLAAEHCLQAMSLHHQMSTRNVRSDMPNQKCHQNKLVEKKANFAPAVRLVWSMSSVPRSSNHYCCIAMAVAGRQADMLRSVARRAQEATNASHSSAWAVMLLQYQCACSVTGSCTP